MDGLGDGYGSHKAPMLIASMYSVENPPVGTFNVGDFDVNGPVATRGWLAAALTAELGFLAK